MHAPFHGLQDYLGQPLQLMTLPSHAASGSQSVSHSQSCHQEHALNSGMQPQDSISASLIDSSGHQIPAVGLSAGIAAQPRPVEMTGIEVLEAVPSLGAEVQLERAQTGVPQQPQGKDSGKPDGAAGNAPGMHGLAATMQLLQQIDLETAGHHTGSSQLPTVLHADSARQQPSLEHRAAADPAAGHDSRLLDSSAPAEAAVIANQQSVGSRADAALSDAVQQSEEEPAQELSGSSQQTEGPQQQADSAEKQSQLHPEGQDLLSEDTGSTQGREAQDLYTDSSHDAASWDVQEQACDELEGKFSAGQRCLCLSSRDIACLSFSNPDLDDVGDTANLLCSAQHITNNGSTIHCVCWVMLLELPGIFNLCL